MGIFSSAKQRHAEELAEQTYYEAAATELANGDFNKGVYAKAISISQGEQTRIDAIYIKLRVSSLKIENAAVNEMISDYERAHAALPSKPTLIPTLDVSPPEVKKVILPLAKSGTSVSFRLVITIVLLFVAWIFFRVAVRSGEIRQILMGIFLMLIALFLKLDFSRLAGRNGYPSVGSTLLDFCFGTVFIGFFVNLILFLVIQNDVDAMYNIYTPWFFGYGFFSSVGGFLWVWFKREKKIENNSWKARS